MQKLGANSAVHANGPCHLMHVAANFLAKIRNLVDERNLSCQEGIGSVLDQLSALDRSNYERRFDQVERPVEIAHDFDRPRIAASNYNAIRPHEITNRSALSQEFRV